MSRAAVFPAFLPLTRQFEGGESIAWPFLDVKGLVTTGMGLLIDDPSMGGLPWLHNAGGPASPAEIADAYQTVKAAQDHSQLGGGNAYWQNLTDLRLDADGFAQAVQNKFSSNENVMRGAFPAFDVYPADAQLGLHLLAWAMGPAFAPKYPKFSAALRSSPPDFATAAQESHLSEVGNPGVHPRNVAMLVAFSNAQAVQDSGSDPDALNYPADLGNVAPGGVPQGGGGILPAVAPGGGLARLIAGVQANKGKIALASGIGLAAAIAAAYFGGKR